MSTPATATAAAVSAVAAELQTVAANWNGYGVAGMEPGALYAHMAEALAAKLLIGPAAPQLVYRAGYRSLPLGWYATADAARRCCESILSDQHPADVALLFDWSGEVLEHGERCALLAEIDGVQERTGYHVTAIEVRAEFDEDDADDPVAVRCRPGSGL
ncbi:hypothetical protein BJP40_02660 [Streptomyces sp. CC53]|uniref:hypothetical protein n=1 Tax=Streptomyces sp. CC53 TaxID=1906740 RepID=UPI0008DD1D6A|nr:hypothetical protein [Streptomyces sp. CC53]OII63799.1 hypothetical protein BJP40_02660 [Streptomyces sp. CC53]